MQIQEQKTVNQSLGICSVLKLTKIKSQTGNDDEQFELYIKHVSDVRQYQTMPINMSIHRHFSFLYKAITIKISAMDGLVTRY